MTHTQKGCAFRFGIKKRKRYKKNTNSEAVFVVHNFHFIRTHAYEASIRGAKKVSGDANNIRQSFIQQTL